jgi:hypothetical protein
LDDHRCRAYDGVDVFEALDSADLLVMMGMHWRGMVHPSAGGLPYRPMQLSHKLAFERHVASGKPLLLHHAAIYSYDDWPRFSQLVGFRWDWEKSSFVNITEYQVEIKPTGHPVLDGVENYTIVDEVYINIQVAPGFVPQDHAAATFENPHAARHNGHTLMQEAPLVFTAEGGRVPGAGRLVYLVNGHDMRAFSCPALRLMWINAVRWLLA